MHERHTAVAGLTQFRRLGLAAAAIGLGAALGGHLLAANAGAGAAPSLQREPLQAAFARAATGVTGRVGACARDAATVVCLNGDQRFSLQSVMKLMVGLAVLDRVDRDGWKLDDRVVVRRSDLSVGVQPIAELITADGYPTTIADLVRRAIVHSDSAATDILIARLGGPPAVQTVLDRHRAAGVDLAGMRIDRDERHLQPDTIGLTWKPEYVDGAVLTADARKLTDAQREAAYRAYQQDVRDTSTPRAMVALLHALAAGKLLSPSSTAHLLDVMRQTTTFPDRLKAGVPAGWTLGHKTGTSGSWKGLTVATNDVGVITAPDGSHISIAVFIGDTTSSSEDRAKVMAAIARETVAHYR